VRFLDTTIGRHSIVRWTFGHATAPTSRASSPDVVWQTPGRYLVVFVITQNGAQIALQHTITIEPQPEFIWSPTPPVAGRPVTFSDMTVGTHGVAKWSFSGASPGTSTARTAEVVWKNPGRYLVSLTTVAPDGLRAITIRRITVTDDPPEPSLVMEASSGTAGQPVLFTDTTGGPHARQWTFDQGHPGSSTSAVVSVIWDDPGNYGISLTITDTGQFPYPRPVTVMLIITIAPRVVGLRDPHSARGQ
jgi:hypothetical protein